MKRLILLFFLVVSNLVYGQLNIDHYIRVGETRIQVGNYTGAIENFNIVIRFKPHLPEPYFYRGIAKHQLEDYRGAILDYDKAIDIKPFYPDAYTNRALAYLQLNEYEKAIADYTRAAGLDPNNANIFNNRGIAKMSIKDVEGAIADYGRALEINPKLTNSLINRSNARLLKSDVTGAIKDLNQAIIIRPHFANAYLLRGLARFELNDYASALRDFDQCLKLDPQSAYAYVNRGIVKQKLEDFRGAIVDYNAALQLDPTLANAYMNRGIAKEALKQPGSADDYAMAARLDPRFSFNPQNVDYSGLQSKQNAQAGSGSQASNAQAGNPSSGNQQTAAGNRTDQGGQAKNDPKQESKEERDRRRLKLALSDSKNLSVKQEVAEDDGFVQNRNIIIDLQPVFVICSSGKDDLTERIQYYNQDIESLNNFNNYNPLMTISNKPFDNLRDFYTNSILFFNEKIKVNSSVSQNFLSRGIFYGLTDDYNNALKDLQKAIDLDSNNALSYFSRANCRLQLVSQIEQVTAEAELISLPITKEGRRPVTKQAGVETSDDYLKVMADYDACLKINPGFQYAYFNRAYAKCKTKDFRGALDDLNKAIEMESDFAEAYFNRGLTRIYLDDVDGGAMDLSKAGELGIAGAYNVIKRYCN